MIISKNEYLKYISFLIILVPFALVSGPFISDSIIVLVAAGSLFYTKDILLKIKIKKIMSFFLIFFIFLILNSLLSKVGYISYKPSFTYIRFILFFIFFLYIFNYDESFKKKLLISFFSIFIILSFDVILEFFYGKNIMGHTFNGQRIQSLFGDEWIVGSYISKIIPIIICLIFYHFEEYPKKYTKKKQIIVIGLIICLSVFVTILSGERSALFSLLLYSLLLLIFLDFKFLHKLTIVVILSLIFLISIFAFKPTYDRIFKQTYKQLNIFDKNYKKDHQLIFETSYKIFKNNNKLIGSGLKSFRVICKEKKYFTKIGCTTHPHNFYLLFLTELGILGLLFLIAFFVYLNLILFLKYFKYRSSFFDKKIYSNQCLSILIGLYVFIFPLKTHGNFFNNWLSICFILQLSLLVATYLKSDSKNDRV